MISKIEELTKKVCVIKAKNNMARVSGLNDRFYEQMEKDSSKAGILNRSAREKR